MGRASAIRRIAFFQLAWLVHFLASIGSVWSSSGGQALRRDRGAAGPWRPRPRPASPRRRGIAVEGEQAEGLLVAGDLEQGHPAAGALLELGEDPLDQRMARGEEVERLLVHRPLAAEGAEESGAEGDAEEMVHQRLVAVLDPPGPLAALRLHLEAEAGGGAHHHALVQGVEIGRHAGEDPRRHLRPVGIAVELVIGGLLHPVVRRLRLAQDLFEVRGADLLRTLDRRLLDRPRHVAQLRLQPAERLAEEADPLVEAGDGAAEPGGRAEVDDLGGDRAADAVEPADPLLDHARVPGQVEEDEPAAELEVPPLAARLGGDQDRRPLGEPELRHLDVPPLGRELLVEDAGAPPLPLDRRP